MIAIPSHFPDLEPTVLPPVEQLSAGRRLTRRQHADIERRIHPLTRERINTNGETCGSCVFRRPGRFPKCWWRPGETGGYPFITNGLATDCRASWPACKRWEAKP
jgi:hypothetical protein